jgi:hypothetical protein
MTSPGGTAVRYGVEIVVAKSIHEGKACAAAVTSAVECN